MYLSVPGLLLSALVSVCWSFRLGNLRIANSTAGDETGYTHINLTGLCPSQPNWRYIEGSCYLPVYARGAVYENILQARDHCRRFGGDLASFPSYHIEQRVYDKLIDDQAMREDLKMYIGLNDCCDNTTEDVWSWPDGSPANYTAWGKGEPNNLGGEGNEDCVVTSKRKQWQDYPCCTPAGISSALCMRPSKGTQPSRKGIFLDWDPLQWACYLEKCKTDPCMNGGACVPLPPMDFRCECPEEFTGRRCEIEVKCLEPPYVQKSTRLGTVLSHGSVISYTCDKDHAFLTFHKGKAVIVTERNITCHKGLWKPLYSNQHCQRLKCTVIPSWNGLIPDIKDRYIGSEVNYTCAEGLHFSNHTGYFITSCNSSREWDPPLQICLEDNPPPKYVPVPVEAAGAEAIGTVAIVFMTCELTLFLLMDLAIITGQIGVLKQNLRDFASRFHT